MGSTKIIGLDSYLKRMERELTDHWVNTQTFELLDYAEKKIKELGNSILSYHSANGMDRTGNLLDSLCWGLYYNNKRCGYGFYRDQKATEESNLHEWFSGDISSLFPVYGHGMAERFIGSYKTSYKGWVLFFAILAPYWGYWEEGFKMKTGGGSRFMQFAVMSQFYDGLKRDLKPAKVSIKVHVAKYNTHKRNDLESLVKSTSRNKWKEDRWFKKFPRMK